MSVGLFNRAVVAAMPFVPRPLELGEGGAADVAPTGDWDVVAESFEALAEQMGC